MKKRVLPAYHTVLFSISNVWRVFSHSITHLAGLSNPLVLLRKEAHAKSEADKHGISNPGGNPKRMSPAYIMLHLQPHCRHSFGWPA